MSRTYEQGNWDKISMTIHDMDFSDEPVYTPFEFSVLIGVSLQTVNRWDRSKFLCANHIKFNNRVYRYYTQEQYLSFVGSDAYLNLPHVKNSDIIGTYVGKLYIRNFSESAIRKGYYGSYVCECGCGNVVELPRSELLSGKAKSCGCKFVDLSGKDFGYWHVDSIADCIYTPGGFKLFAYSCTCRCGTKRVVIARSLTSGSSQSCGCLRDRVTMSKCERHVRMYLESLGLSDSMLRNDDCYVQHKTYPDLVGLGGGLLSYDFYLKIDGKAWYIECQGGQHYRPVELWGGVEAFEKQAEHDARKRDYAKLHNIPLIEIPYYVLTYDSVCSLLRIYDIK